MSATTQTVLYPRPGAKRRRRLPLYAALDLGTNNCRLLIARPKARDFEIVDSFARIVRLGEGLSARGSLSDAAMGRAIEALKLCAGKMKRRGVTHSRAVATEACRRATNGADFVERVRAETGLKLEIIGHDEEAQLAMAGCAALLDPAARRALVFDIGGGSTELIWLNLADRQRGPRLEAWASLPIGVVTLAEAHPADRVSREAFAAMAHAARLMLAPFEAAHGLVAEIAQGGVQMIGSSGTVTTLAGVHLGLERYDRAKVDGLALAFDAVRQVSARLAAMSCAERARLPTVGADRADLVVAGAVVLDAVMDLWPAGRLTVADRGLREGILRGMMARAQGAPPPFAQSL